MSGVPSEVLNPSTLWTDKADFDATLTQLARLFQTNAKQFLGDASAWRARPACLAGPADDTAWHPCWHGYCMPSSQPRRAAPHPTLPPSLLPAGKHVGAELADRILSGGPRLAAAAEPTGAPAAADKAPALVTCAKTVSGPAAGQMPTVRAV